MSAYELARGYTKPLTEAPSFLPNELLVAHDTLDAKRRLTRILRSKSPHAPAIAPGDLVEVYVKLHNQKRGSWSAPRTVLAADLENDSVLVPGLRGRSVKAALEDVRVAITDDCFAQLVREANDALDRNIDIELLNMTSVDDDNIPLQLDKPAISADTTSPVPMNEADVQFDPLFGDDDEPQNVISTAAVDPPHDVSSNKPSTGDKVEVFWSLDNQYYPGLIAEEQGTSQTVVYDDGGIETLDFDKETWRYASSVKLMSMLASSLRLTSDSSDVLASIFKFFGNKPFLKHQAQGFPNHVLINAFSHEEKDFKKTVRMVPLNEISNNANIISSHTIYKIKICDEQSLKLKVRIAPHGNEDSSRYTLRSDCSMCPPSSFRIIASLASLRKWRLFKLDVKTAFLQTGAASRNVYIVPPQESTDRYKFLWLLLTASYGLLNANAKWQVVSDQALHDIGLSAITVLPQLFYLSAPDGAIKAALAKIVDDFLLCGETAVVNDVIENISNSFKLGTILHGPGVLRYFGLNVTQHDDFTVTIDGDDKLNAISTAPITRVRRRDVTDSLTPAEIKLFASINSSIRRLGITASPFCATFSSLFQQTAPTATIASLSNQSSRLKKLQRIGTSVHYGRPDDNLDHVASVVVFCDAGRSAEAGQLCHISGLLIDDLARGSIMHIVSWSSHKAHRPVRSTAAAETIAAGEGIDIGKSLASVYSLLLYIPIALIIVLDSKDLFTTLTTQRQSVYRSIRGDIGVIRFEFETQNVSKIIWIPGKTNPADIGTKFDSPLTDTVAQLLATGKFPFDLDTHDTCASNRSLG